MQNTPLSPPPAERAPFARVAASWARLLATGERDGSLCSPSRVGSVWDSGVGDALGLSRPDALAGLGQGAGRALRGMSTEGSESIFAFFPDSTAPDPLGAALPSLRAIAASAHGAPWGALAAAQWRLPEHGLVFVACFAPGARAIGRNGSRPQHHASNKIFTLFDQIGRKATGRSSGGRPEAMLASLGEMWSAERRYPGHEEPLLALALFSIAPDASLDEIGSAMERSHALPSDRDSFTARLSIPAERRALDRAVASPSAQARRSRRL